MSSFMSSVVISEQTDIGKQWFKACWAPQDTRHQPDILTPFTRFSLHIPTHLFVAMCAQNMRIFAKF